MSTTDSSAVLADAAFGADPGRWPLPTATTTHDRWLRAVAAGGQGRYAAARTELAALQAVPSLGSLAYSTDASFWRQLGWHDRARTFDGKAYALADDPDAGADALIGLAADALGVGRFAASSRALERARPLVAGARLPVRHAWVSAELAMATGEGAAAVGHAERAVALAADFGSTRHVLKSTVVLAAAHCCAGQLDRSRTLADAALDESGRLGLVPLRWALASLLAAIGSAARSPEQIERIRDESAQTVCSRGGVWRVG